jgi:hypothetical protein
MSLYHFPSFRFGFILFITLSFSLPSLGQRHRDSCTDLAISSQANEIKKASSQKMVVFNEVQLYAESMTPIPVVIQLKKGRTYQFVVVADPDASRIEFELYDDADVKVYDRVVKGGSNQIIYQFKAEETSSYLATVMQKKRGSAGCLYFSTLVNSPAIRPRRKTTTQQPNTGGKAQNPVLPTTTWKPAATTPPEPGTRSPKANSPQTPKGNQAPQPPIKK